MEPINCALFIRKGRELENVIRLNQPGRFSYMLEHLAKGEILRYPGVWRTAICKRDDRFTNPLLRTSDIDMDIPALPSGALELCNMAIKFHRREVVTAFIERGLYLDEMANDWDTPLICAIDFDKPEILEELLEAGANVEFAPNRLESPLMMAVKGASVAVVELLLKYGAEPNMRDVIQRHAGFFTAARGTDVIELLVNYGLDVHHLDYKGNSVMHEEAQHGSVENIKAWMAVGCDAKLRNENGRTPLHRAAWGDKESIVKVLIENGGDVNAQDNQGMTPLLLAANYTRDGGVIRSLVEAGADVNYRNAIDNETPLTVSYFLMTATATAALLSLGADILAWPFEGWPYMEAGMIKPEIGHQIALHLARLSKPLKPALELKLASLEEDNKILFNELSALNRLHANKLLGDLSLVDILVCKEKDLSKLLKDDKIVEELLQHTIEMPFQREFLRVKIDRARKTYLRRREHEQAVEDWFIWHAKEGATPAIMKIAEYAWVED